MLVALTFASGQKRARHSSFTESLLKERAEARGEPRPFRCSERLTHRLSDRWDVFRLPDVLRKPSQPRGETGSMIASSMRLMGKNPAASAKRIKSRSSKSSIGSASGG